MSPVPAFEQKKVVSFFVILGWLGLAAGGLWLLYALRDLLPPFIVATIFAMTLTPEVDRLERQGLFGRRFPRGLAIAVIYALFLGFGGLIVKGLSLVSVQMTELIRQHFGQFLTASPAAVAAQTKTWLVANHVPSALRAPILTQAKHIPELLAQGVSWFSDNLPALAGSLAVVVLVPFITFFILLDFNKILGKSLLLVPKDKREGILATVTDIIAVFGSYIRGVTTVMALDMLVIFVVLWAFGGNLRDYALTLAITAGLLNTIPYFGPLVSTTLMGLVTLAVLGPSAALAVVGVMVVIHQLLFDFVIAPRVIGGSVHLHPLLTLIALMVGGTLFKLGGTLLAVPIAAALQVILIRLFPQLETDVVAVRRAAKVVQKTIAKDSEAAAPAPRKAGDEAALQQEQDTARAAAQDTQILPRPGAG